MPLSSSLIFHKKKPLPVGIHTLNPAKLNTESEGRGFEILESYIAVDVLGTLV